MTTGAFAVFGMSRELAKRRAASDVDKGNKPKTMDEYIAAVAEKAEHIFTTSVQSAQISPAFDAPQFARDWIAVAGDQIRNPTVKQREQYTAPGGALKYHWV